MAAEVGKMFAKPFWILNVFWVRKHSNIVSVFFSQNKARMKEKRNKERINKYRKK